MSLKGLLRWHYFSVQENITRETQLSDGSLDRKNSWLTCAQNLNGNIQSYSQIRDDRVMDYAQEEWERRYIIFHEETTVPVGGIDTYIKLNMRVLVHQNPKTKLTFDGVGDVTTSSDDVRIFKIISNKEPVALRERNLTLFELHIEENPRMSL